jgi:uncharacterized protein YegP (UPF0339 family)
MYYYIYSDEGASFPFLMTSANHGQIIRDTHFSYIAKKGTKKSFRLVKTEIKLYPDVIFNNIDNLDSIPFEYVTGENSVCFDKYEIEFTIKLHDNENCYVFCPTLMIV